MCTSVGYSSVEMVQLQSELLERVRYSTDVDSANSSSSDIVSVISQLKFHKRDGYSGLSKSHFKHANMSLHAYIAALFTGMLVYGAVPGDLSHSTTTPIGNGGKCNATNSENYRGITLSSVFGQISDLILLNKGAPCFISDDLQFCFQRNSSTAIYNMVQKSSFHLH
jgi:hypothetical protein